MAPGLTPAGACRVDARVVLLALLAVVLVGCAGPRRGPTYPPAGATPQVATGETAAARSAVVTALAPTGLQVIDATRDYRPPVGAWLASAPRTVLELDAPASGTIGFILISALGSSADATAAARDQARYVSSGPGRVYFPGDARFTIRVVGSSVVFFTWSPGTGDPRLAQVESSLGGIGTGVAVPA